MQNRSGTVMLACLGLLATVVTAWADEEKVPLDKVPAAVMKSVKAKFPKAEIKQAEKEVEDGKTTYELGLTDGGRNIDVTLKDDGTIVEIEKELAVKDLPEVVAAAVKAKYPKGTVKRAEEVTKGETKTFEVVVADGKKSREVVIDPAGKILEDDEEGED